MRKYILKAKAITHSCSGETIMESIASLLILSILLLSVTTMLQAALRTTALSTQKAADTQENIINPIILSEYSESEMTSITFKVADIDINATHVIRVNKDTNIIAFTPLETWEVEP